MGNAWQWKLGAASYIADRSKVLGLGQVHNLQSLFVMSDGSQLGPTSQVSKTSPNSGISWRTSVLRCEPVGKSSPSSHNRGLQVVEYSGYLFVCHDFTTCYSSKNWPCDSTEVSAIMY